LEQYKELLRQQQLEANRATASTVNIPAASAEEIVVATSLHQMENNEDDSTVKLRKLKTLFDQQLITQTEYEIKKQAILDSL
jgi:uncharacterized protein YfaQ (DUF2300 family)